MHGYTRAFTVYELLITLALVATLVALGMPSFSALAAKSRQSVEINALFHAFHQARKESITRRRIVSLCPSRDLQTCEKTTDWSTGWLLFHGSAGTARPGDRIVTRHAVAETMTVSANRLIFTSRGTYRRTTNGTIVVCDRLGRTDPKALVISHTGRPRVAERRPDGSAWSCAD